MDFKVIWAPSARLDLKEIVSYIAEDNPEIAQRFGLTLIDATKYLASFPGRGRAVPKLARMSHKIRRERTEIECWCGFRADEGVKLGRHPAKS